MTNSTLQNSPPVTDWGSGQVVDPVEWATTLYERHRDAIILDALSRERYGRAFEVACGLGALTCQLAKRCDEVVAIDVCAATLQHAKTRCVELSHVQLQTTDLRTSLPEGKFDLIVFSEVGYGLTGDELRQIAHGLGDRLAPGGEFVAVHRLRSSSPERLDGDVVHGILAASLPLRRRMSKHYPGFRLEMWHRG